MKMHDGFLLREWLVILCLVTAAPSHAQTFNALTLISPNPDNNGDFSFAISGADDINGDGFADVVVGALGEDTAANEDAGRAYIFNGQDGSLLFALTSPNEQALGYFGWSVSGTGDVNGDEVADVIVGAMFEDSDAGLIDVGRAYIFSGQNGSLLFELISPNEEADAGFGNSVSGAGDVNDDGFADVIVGSAYEDPGTSPLDAGRAYIFSGEDGSLLFELISPNEETSGLFGWSVSSIDDVNVDGFADVIVGAMEDPGNSPLDAGRVYIFSGQDGSLLFELMSSHEESGGLFGYSVSSAGDVNDDGFADVIVGAQHEDRSGSQDAGRAYVFSGQDGSLIFEPKSPNKEYLGSFGVSVSGAGDVDRDGFADVIVGANNEDPGNSPSGAGRAYIFSGQNHSLLFELMSPNEESGGFFGNAVSDIGDANGDGFADVIVGAYLEDGSAINNAGRAYIFVSSSAQPQTFRINSGGPNYTDASGNLFVADQAYTPGSFGYVGGTTSSFPNPIGNTDDDPLYQDLRRAGTNFEYRFDVSSAGNYDITLHLMAPAMGSGSFKMDVYAEGILVFNDLSVNDEAGGTFKALIKTFTTTVNDGTLNLKFVKVNKAAIVSGIAVVQQTGAAPLSKAAGVSEELVADLPQEFRLFQNYPNPFNPEAEICFQLPEASHVHLSVFNTRGQEIRALADGQYQAGEHRVRWDGKDYSGNFVSSGIYFYCLRSGAFSRAKKMSLLR